MKSLKLCTKDLSTHNSVNRKRHIESSSSCKGKENVKRIVNFFQQVEVTHTSNERSENNNKSLEDDSEVDFEFCHPYVEKMEASSVNKNNLKHGDVDVDCQPEGVEDIELGGIEYDEPIEVEDENSLDVGSSEHLEPIEVAGENLVEHRSIGHVKSNVKCEGHHILVQNPADLYKNFPFTLLANEDFVF